MKLIYSSHTIEQPISGTDILKNIEKAGRTCYKSEDRIDKNSSTAFVKMIMNKGHLSVIEHQSITVRFICDRGVSHELVRHRLSSFSQESTRYCMYTGGITYIIPNWLAVDSSSINTIDDIDLLNLDYVSNVLLRGLLESEKTYMELINNNVSAQQARAILPNATKTEIVVTANLRQWREILKQRTASSAHPAMRDLMNPLLIELKELVPIIFDDIIGSYE